MLFQIYFLYLQHRVKQQNNLVMEKIRYYCPECGFGLVQGDWDYNYETAHLDFECPCCGWTGTENDVIDDELNED